MRYNSKLSTYQLKKIIRHFCADIEASKTALLTGFNRNTINHWYNIFRQEIYRYQSELKEQLYGSIEVDESYFGAKRQRGFHGKLKRGRGTLKQPVFGIFEREGGLRKSFLIVTVRRPCKTLYWVKSAWIASSILIVGVDIVDWLMWVIASICVLITDKMNLLMAADISTV